MEKLSGIALKNKQSDLENGQVVRESLGSGKHSDVQLNTTERSMKLNINEQKLLSTMKERNSLMREQNMLMNLSKTEDIMINMKKTDTKEIDMKVIDINNHIDMSERQNNLIQRLKLQMNIVHIEVHNYTSIIIYLNPF